MALIIDCCKCSVEPSIAAVVCRFSVVVWGYGLFGWTIFWLGYFCVARTIMDIVVCIVG